MNIEDFYGWLDFFNNPNLAHLSEDERRILYRKLLNEKEQSSYQNLLTIGAAAAAVAAGGSAGGAGEPFVETPFTITIDTTKIGSASNQFTLPLYPDQTYNAIIDWGDNTTTTQTTASDPTHTYPSSGIYQIKISGVFPGIYFNSAGDRRKLLSIDNWGTGTWKRMDNAFMLCQNMEANYTDIPNTTQVTSMANMFYRCSKFNGKVEFDTSNVTTMQSMLYWCDLFNQPINFNTSKVTNFFEFLALSNAFNQPLNHLDTRSVTILRAMFFGNTGFNQDISSWNVENVTDFDFLMFNKTDLNYDAAKLDAIYNKWTSQKLKPSKTIQFGTIKRTAASTAARALLTRTNETIAISSVSNNGSNGIRVITSTAHGRTTGDKIFIYDSGTEVNGGWNVTVINSTMIDLQGSTFVSNYTTGTVRIGYGWTITDGGI